MHLPRIPLLLLGLFFLWTPHAQGTVRVAMTSWSAHVPLTIARDQGLWMRADLDVILIPFEDGRLLHEALHSGRVDVAIGRVGDVVGMAMNGLDIRILMETGFSDGDHVLLVRDGFEVEDWQSGPVGTIEDSPAIWFFLDRYLAPRNLSVSDFRLVTLPGESLVQNYLARRLPILVVTCDLATTAQASLPGRRVATTAVEAGVMPFCLFATSLRTDTFSEREVLLFLEGWIRAVAMLPEIFKGDGRDVRFDIFDEVVDAKALSGLRFHDAGELLARNAPGGGLEGHVEGLLDFLERIGRDRRKFEASKLIHPLPEAIRLQLGGKAP